MVVGEKVAGVKSQVEVTVDTIEVKKELGLVVKVLEMVERVVVFDLGNSMMSQDLTTRAQMEVGWVRTVARVEARMRGMRHVAVFEVCW